MPLVTGRDTDTIPLLGGDSCEILRRWSQGDIMDMQQMMASGIKMGVQGEEVKLEEMDTSQMIEASTFAALIVGVRSWTMKDAAGEPVPLTPLTLRLLDPTDYDTIVKAINERTSPKKSEEEKND